MSWWNPSKVEVTFPAPLEVKVTSESRDEMSCDCCSKLFYLETLKPRLDSIDAQLAAILARDQSDAMKAGQDQVNAEAVRLGAVRDKLHDIEEIKSE